jgi:hypothetical protein
VSGAPLRGQRKPDAVALDLLLISMQRRELCSVQGNGFAVSLDFSAKQRQLDTSGSCLSPLERTTPVNRMSAAQD